MKTTQKDFKEFKAEFNRMIDVLGLKSWNCAFSLEKINDHTMADINYDCMSRFANIRLNTDKLVGKCMKNFARHEVYHLLLADLYDCATKRYVSKSELDQIEEGVVVILEKLNV
jgi:hypothetical protein